MIGRRDFPLYRGAGADARLCHVGRTQPKKRLRPGTSPSVWKARNSRREAARPRKARWSTRKMHGLPWGKARRRPLFRSNRFLHWPEVLARLKDQHPVKTVGRLLAVLPRRYGILSIDRCHETRRGRSNRIRCAPSPRSSSSRTAYQGNRRHGREHSSKSENAESRQLHSGKNYDDINNWKKRGCRWGSARIRPNTHAIRTEHATLLYVRLQADSRRYRFQRRALQTQLSDAYFLPRVSSPSQEWVWPIVESWSDRTNPQFFRDPCEAGVLAAERCRVADRLPHCCQRREAP